jgi:hypothetical protein
MKSLLVLIFGAVLLVGCGESQQQTVPDPTEVKLVEPVAEAAKAELPVTTATPAEAQPPQPVAEGPVQDAKAANPQANRALMAAAAKGNIEAIKQQLAAGADVNAKDEEGATPLHYAATKAVAELLITKGTDVNAKGGYKNGTALHFAAAVGHNELVALLIANNADVNAKIELGEYKGETPLDYAKGETADLLRKHGGKTGEELKAEGK